MTDVRCASPVARPAGAHEQGMCLGSAACCASCWHCHDAARLPPHSRLPPFPSPPPSPAPPRPLRSISGKFDTVSCLDVMIHYPQDKVDAMITHLAGLSSRRLIVSFAPKTLSYSILKRIGELFPGPSKVRGEGGGGAGGAGAGRCRGRCRGTHAGMPRMNT